MQPRIFQSREGFVQLGHLDKRFVKNTGKKAGENLGDFSLRYS